jgi:hypothetical protein
MVDEERDPAKSSSGKTRKKGSPKRSARGTSLKSPRETEKPVAPDESASPEENVQSPAASPNEKVDPVTGMVAQERLVEIMNDLRGLDLIIDDKGQEVEFSGAAKQAFIQDVENAYPVFGAALNSLYETGKFLFEVRERQKKNNLWMKYQEVIGQSPSFINNYIRVYEKFRERLPEFSHLGVSKLEVVARLKEPVAYIEANQEFIEKAPFREVRKSVTAEKARGVKHRSKKREDRIEDVGPYRLKLSSNGRSFTISNLNKEIQDELLNLVKEHLSQKK